MATYFVLLDPVRNWLKQTKKRSARGIFEEMSVSSN